MSVRTVASLLTALALLGGCTAPLATSWRDTSKLALKELTVADYFPRDSGLGHDEKARYSKLLFELEERPISELGQSGKAYRFIWERSFDQPLSVTAYFPDSRESHITGKYVETQPRTSASEPFRQDALKSKDIPMSNAQAAELLKKFDDYGFFKLDPNDEYTRPPNAILKSIGLPDPSSEDSMHDGARWIMEGWDHGRYLIVQRQSPDGRDPIRQLAAQMMIDADVLPDKPKAIY